MTSPQQQSDLEKNPCADRPRHQEPVWRPERLKVSQVDGAILSRPSITDAGGLYHRNRDLFESLTCEIQGESLKHHRLNARQELIELAVEYTSRLRNQLVERPATDGLICDGHQPLLFHSGVWAKNFVLGGIAQQLQATALHLIVDNDTWSQNGVTVPVGDIHSPSKKHVSFASELQDQPWEETKVTNPEMFRTFCAEVNTEMAHWGIEPLLNVSWSAAIEAADAGWSLPDCLTAARHQLEQRWGLQNLELPMSHVCDSDSFRRFFCHIIAHMPCFRELYNEVLAEYRDVNRVRSQTHPVPELKESDGWLEAPFWVWSVNDPKRQPLFVKKSDDSILLRGMSGEIGHLDLMAGSSPRQALEQLKRFSAEGWRFRSRALTTTLFSRLFLSDLFLHGIGGAKYDEMTDRLMSRFYGVEPPAYLTLSGTWHLPLGQGHDDLLSRKRHIERRLRDTQHNPEKVMSDGLTDELQALLIEKNKLIKQQQQVDAGAKLGESQREHHRLGCQRFRRLKEINAILSEAASDRRESIQRELAIIESQIEADKIINSREYAFVLFPESKLKLAMQSLMRLEEP